MKRAIATGVALLTTLGFAAAVTAQGPTTSASPHVQQDQRFRQLNRPASIDLGNLPSRTNPDKIVTATVVLAADSVSSAKEKADTAKVTFDKKAAERQAKAAQSAIAPKLRAAGGNVRTSTSTVLNTITVRAKVKDLKSLAAVPGVAAVHVSRPIARDNGASDAYTGVAQVWQSLGLTGKGVTVGVIDDGIDYHHADFGGSGDPADYAANDPTTIEPGSFPTVKVTGGYDFVGDAYDANADAPGESDIPVPDPDPLACGEHGTHVSGTAAGQGVLADGTTFTGPYTATTLTDHSFTVAPGSAPEASIKIYKVFGCDGSVNDDVILAAIDRAVADGVSVINMSLGSTWGTATEPIALAIDNATKLGVLSVVSAGNSGPNAYLVGGPSTANTALSVAAADTSSATLPGVAITGDVTLTGAELERLRLQHRRRQRRHRRHRSRLRCRRLRRSRRRGRRHPSRRVRPRRPCDPRHHRRCRRRHLRQQRSRLPAGRGRHPRRHGAVRRCAQHGDRSPTAATSRSTLARPSPTRRSPTSPASPPTVSVRTAHPSPTSRHPV